MPVVECPRWDNWPLPTRGPERFGHCILLRLDPAASVAALDDEEAARAASLVPRDWFLGVTLTDGGAELYAPDGVRLLNFKFFLIGTALPTDYEPGVVPISPLASLVADRPSLTFIPALPVEGLYVHTYPSRSAMISRIHDTSEKALAALNPGQLDQLRRCEPEDEYDRSTLLYEKQLAEEAKRAASPDEADRAEQRSVSSACGSGRASDISDINRYLLTEEMQTRFLQVRVFVEVWLDPAFHAGPPADPAKFSQATAQLEAIWEDWKERMLKETLAKRPQTQDWLQGVQDADGGLDDTLVDAGVPYDDYAVLPEDAIDSRIEKAARPARQVTSPVTALGIASNVQSAPHVIPVDSALGAAETTQRIQAAEQHSNILSPSTQGSMEALPIDLSSGQAQRKHSSIEQSSGIVAQPKSRREKLSTAKRSLAFLQGGLSALRSALGRTRVHAARVFETVNKSAIAS